MEKKVSDEDLLKDITSRLEQLENNRSRFIDRWTEAQRYVSPSVYDWSNLDSIPEQPNRYSSIPCDYLQTLVSGVVGYSISPNIVWFKLSLENQDVLNRYGVKDWLEKVEEVMIAEFNRSNLYQSVPHWVQDSATIGHGTMLTDWDFEQNRLRFSTLRANEVYLDVNEYGEVDTVFRRYLMTLRNMVRFFGLEKLNVQFQEDYKDSGKWNSRYEVLFAVYPREEYNPESKKAEDKPYAAVYVDRTHNEIIEISGYDEFPYAVFEWDQCPGLAYGDSPAINALPDIKFLNIAKETSMKIAQKAADPPMKASATIRNISIVPKGFTYLNDPKEVFEAVKTGENYPITLQVVEGIKQEVKDWFNVDFFLMLQQRSAQMTATEVQELQGEKAAVLSNLIVAENTALTHIISRSFDLLSRAGRIPEPPVAVKQSGVAMKVDFVGPLAQAQKKYHSLGGTTQALQLLGPILSLYPNAGDYIDGDELMKHAMNGQGMPQSVIREEDDVKKIREARVQAQQQAQMQAQQQQMMTDVLNNAGQLGEKAQSGSVMDMLNQQLAGGLSNG